MRHLIVVLTSLMLLAIIFTACNQAENKTEKPVTLQQKIANAYGEENFSKIKSVAFTFNIKKDTISNARSWVWNVPGNIVSYTKGTETMTYRRDTVASEAMKKIDGMFINDQYWLLFPYHLAWDSGMNVTVKEKQMSPIGKQEYTMLTSKYDDNGGYTPGDSYDLFVDENNMIREWMFHKGGSAEPSITTTWSEPETIGGLKISTDHINADSSFRIYFTGIKVN
ncbi:MAG: hypothetical protein ABIT96_09685 [Ferruginibacter sp.]